MKCFTKPNNPCPQGVINAKCVVYTGSNLTNISVTTNDRLEVILQKINDAIDSLDFTLFIEDTESVDLSGAGTFSNPLSADVNLSSASGNSLSILADGLYSPQITSQGLLEGGEVTWTGTDLDFDVAPAHYTILGIEYDSLQTSVTLTAADPSEDRIDVFYVDNTGSVGFITGVAEPNPVKPQIDPATQIELTSVYIPAGSLIPLITTVKIYDENIEWTTSQVGTTVNFSDTSTPQLGTIDANVTTINDGDYLLFTNSFDVNITFYDSLSMFVKLKAVLPSTGNLLVSFQDAAGTQLTTEVVVPINKSNISTYQGISIPIPFFNTSNPSVRKFRIRYSNPGTALIHSGFYVDNIYLQDGIIPPLTPFLYTASNGLTMFGTDVQLGGLLHKNTNITTGIYQINLSGATTPSSTFNFNVVNSTGSSIKGQTTTGTGVQGISAGSNGYGVFGQNSVGPAGGFLFTNSSGSTSATVVNIQRATSGTPSAGMGANLTFLLSGTSTPSTPNLPSNRIVSTWTNATTLSQTSQLVFTGTNAAVEADLLTLSGNGQARLNKYGVNTFTGTMVKYLAVTSNGTVIESDPGAGGEVISADNGLTENVPGNVQLGGTLLQNTTINGSTFSTFITSSTPGAATLNVTQTHASGIGMIVTGNAGRAMTISTTGNSDAVTISSSNTSGAGLNVTTVATSAVIPNVIFSRSGNSGTPDVLNIRNTTSPSAVGLGSAISFTGLTTGVSQRQGSLRFAWTDNVQATRVSQFVIGGVNNAVEADLFTLSGNGSLQLNKYGVGSFTAGTPVYNLSVTNTGQVIETLPGAGGELLSADNGLTENVPNNVQLGGTLLQNTGIATGAFTLALSTSTALATPFTSTATTGNAITGTATTGIGVAGNSQGTGNATGQFQNTGGGIAGRFIGNGTTVLWAETNAASTNTVIRTILFDRKTSGTAADGIGNSIEIGNEKSDGNTAVSTQLISKWTTATNTLETSQFIITGVNAAVTADLLTLSGNGATRFNKYGTGAITAGAAAFGLAVDANGNVIEVALGGGGGGTVNSVAGTLNRITSTGGTDPVIDISASYVGQTSITTLGTLTTGATGAGFTVALGTSTITGQLAMANGGTGANLTDPGADRLLFWDDSAGAMTFLTLGTNLSITGTTINAAGGGGSYTETETSVASDTTPNPTGDSRFNYYDLTALAGGATFAAPSGTPANHNRLTIRILDDGTARSLAWNAIYRSGAVVILPTTTIANEAMYVEFIYNSQSSTWDCLGVSDGYA